MRSFAADLDHASIEQLLVCARDALNVAGRHPERRRATGQYVDVNKAIGTLTQTAQALTRAIDELARAITTQNDSGRVVAVDGPFAGDPDAATEAANLWLAKGHQVLDELTLALVNAHIAAGGLAAKRILDGGASRHPN